MSRAMPGMFQLLLACLVFCLPTTSSSAQTPTDSRWGLLGEMVERDFKGCALLMSFRWIEHNRALEMSCWAILSRAQTTFTMDQTTGNIEAKGDYARGTLKAQPDGTIILLRDNKIFPLITKNADGSIKYSGLGDLRPIIAGDRGDRHLAKLIASGKIRSANKQLAQTPEPPSSASSSSLATAVTAAAESPKTQPTQATVSATTPHPSSALAQRRLALVIGNSNYGASLGSLPNPINDAATMGQTLKNVGFEVEVVTDADQRTIKRSIARFGERLRAAGRGSVGLFFYAGHGIQSRGVNYLIPVGAAIEAEADVDLESVAADTVLLQMEEAGSSTNIVILDACRNMPISRSFRSGTRGLARMEAPNGSFVAYSTAPGSVAADGDGKNSPFVSALAQQLNRKGQPIEVIFRDVRRSVLETTGGKQTPWDSSSLISPFYFAGE